jgi:hypothetical protein
MALTVKIDHRDIEVRGVPYHHKRVGRFLDQKCRIEVVVEQTARQQADTLVHEVMHAIWATRSMPPVIEEEECVTRMASGWTTVIRDNPELCRVLEQALRNGIPIFKEGE